MRQKYLKVLGLLLFAAASISTVVAVSTHNRTASSSARPGARGTSGSPITVPSAPVNLIRFTLYDAGIYPRQVHTPKGLTAIAIEDFSGGTAGLVIARVDGNDRVPAGQVKRNGSHWRGSEEIQLQPGNYEVYTVEHPSNRSQLVVEP